MLYDEFRAMNTNILLAAEGEPNQVTAGFQLARQFIEESERRFTRFSDQSELASLNRSAGNWFTASKELFEVMLQAKAFWKMTDGLFDPSILPALRQAGYDQNMDDLRKNGARSPSQPEKLKKLDFQTLRFDSKTRGIWMPEGMLIDLGGIAKGWIAEHAAKRLAKFSTNACAVNAGGDMFLIGLPEGGKAWQVGLEDPLDSARDLVTLNTKPGAIATSSVTKRRWMQGNLTRHHLIDPRNGQPAETDWLSVTVFAPHATDAEVFAKALLIAGSTGISDILIDNRETAFIGIDKNGKLWGSDNSKDLIEEYHKYA